MSTIKVDTIATRTGSGNITFSNNVDLTGRTVTGEVVQTANIASSAVTDAKIASNAVTTAKIAGSAVDGSKIAGGAVDGTKIADDAITTAKMNASMITHIDAGSTKAQGVTASFADTNLSGSITIPAGCTKIIWHMRGGFRQNGIGVDHSSYRLKFVTGGTTTYIGNGSWGMGISQQVGANTGSNTSNHSIITLYANLFDYDSDDNQANLAAGTTYTVTVQVKSSSGNGSNLYTFGDVTSNVSYYPAFMTFMFF